MNRMFEATLGLLVLGLFAFFALLLVSNQSGPATGVNSYIAIFSKVDGLRAGDDVRLGGVKIGNVQAVDVDPQSFEVLASIEISDAFQLTQNASAAVLADGLLGGAFLEVSAGFGPPLEAGGYIENTNDAVNLTELLSQFIFGSTGE